MFLYAIYDFRRLYTFVRCIVCRYAVVRVRYCRGFYRKIMEFYDM